MILLLEKEQADAVPWIHHMIPRSHQINPNGLAMPFTIHLCLTVNLLDATLKTPGRACSPKQEPRPTRFQSHPLKS